MNRRLLPSLVLSALSWMPRAMAEQPTPPASREVYIVPFSHLDLYWGGTREECLGRGNRVISRAIEIARADPNFRFLIEANLFLANFAESHRGSPELAELEALIRKNQIQVSPKWTDIMLDLPDGEVIARDFGIGRRYARERFGADPVTANLADIPAFPTQLPQILVLARTPSAVITRLGPPTPLFDWKAPDGSRIRCWYSPRGYDWGANLGLHEDLNPLRLRLIDSQVQLIAAMTKAPVLMHWGIDLYAPSTRVGSNLPALNETFAGRYHFRISALDDYFQAVSQQTQVPELSGEIPSCWPNIVSSLPNLWPAVTPATSALLSAEKFAAVNYALGYADYPSERFEFLWKKLLEACDHNQDGQGGFAGDARKEEYSALVRYEGGELLRDSLRNLAERVRIRPGSSAALVVFNSNAWKRDDVVHAHVTVYGDVAPRQIDDFRRGLRLVDESGTGVAFTVNQYSENISRAYDLTFVAQGVPSLGYKTFYLEPAEPVPSSSVTAAVALDRVSDQADPRRPLGEDLIENDYYRLSVDRATGTITIFDKALRQIVVKDMQIAAREERGGNYSTSEPLSGRTIPEIIDTIEVKHNDAVSATVQLDGAVGDVPITQRLTLYKALRRIEIQNVVTWSKPRYFRLEQVIPYQLVGPRIQYGVPFGSNEAGNVMPGSGPRSASEISRDSWINGRMIHDWIAAQGPAWQLSLAADHPFVRLEGGTFRAQMLRGTKFSTVRIVSQAGTDSMQYPQPGKYTFNYALTSKMGTWKDNQAYRFGNDFNTPLIAVSATDELEPKSLPATRSFLESNSPTAILSALKKQEGGQAIVARFYEIEGKSGPLEIRWLGQRQTPRQLNLLEEPMPGDAGHLKPFEIKTLCFQSSSSASPAGTGQR